MKLPDSQGPRLVFPGALEIRRWLLIKGVARADIGLDLLYYASICGIDLQRMRRIAKYCCALRSLNPPLVLVVLRYALQSSCTYSLPMYRYSDIRFPWLSYLAITLVAIYLFVHPFFAPPLFQIL